MQRAGEQRCAKSQFWVLFFFCSIFTFSPAGHAQVIHHHCRSGQTCYTHEGTRICAPVTHCWFTLDQSFGIYTDPEGYAGGIGLPITDSDQQPDAAMDCWKGVTTLARLTSGFPLRNDGTTPHNGIDVASDAGNYGHGAPVKSLGAGYVSEVGASGANGNFIRIRQADGIEITYIHLLDSQTADGGSLQISQKVWAGTQIGRMNCTGNCGGVVGDPNRGSITKTHVHIQARRLEDGKLVSPTDLYGGESCVVGGGSGGSSGGGSGGGPGGGTGTCTGGICSEEP